MKNLVELMNKMRNMQLPDATYDRMKLVSLVLLPAIGGLYLSLCSIWGIPVSIEFLVLVSFLSALIGGLAGISANNYYEAFPEYIQSLRTKIKNYIQWATMYSIPASTVGYYILSIVARDLPYSSEIIQTLVTIAVMMGLSVSGATPQMKDFFTKAVAIVEDYKGLQAAAREFVAIFLDQTDGPPKEK